MLSMVALVATSCKKKEETNSFGGKFATFEAVDIDDERAYLHPETLLSMWDEGDQIKVFNFEKSKSAIFQVEIPGSNQANFVNQGEGVGYASGYYAFYPAEMAEEDFDGVYQKFVLDPIQHVRALDDYTTALQTISIPQAAYTTYEDNYYNFQAIFGIANFKVLCSPLNGNTRYVEKIVVEDNHFNLCGEVTLKPNKIDGTKLTEMINYLRSGNDEAYLQKWGEYVISHEGDGLGYSAIGGGNELTYDFSAMNGGKGIALNGNDTRNLMVGLRPGALAFGFTVKLYVWDGDDMKIIKINKFEDENRLYAIRPGKIAKFNIGSITQLVDNYQPQP
jgi:hypothetical protein